MIETGLALPGGTVVGTDSHLNILGAIGAFGQGMGDQDIAFAFKAGKTWFEVPPTMKVTVKGDLQLSVHPQGPDPGRACGCWAPAARWARPIEFYGPAIEALDLPGRITLSSMVTEMGGIIGLIPPSEAVLDYCRERSGRADLQGVYADPDAEYVEEIVVDITDLEPLIACPPKPDNVKTVREVAGHAGRLGVHRLLHQRPLRGPAPGGRPGPGQTDPAVGDGLDRACHPRGVGADPAGWHPADAV